MIEQGLLCLTCRRKILCNRRRSVSKANDGEIDAVLLLKPKYQTEKGNVKTAMKQTNNLSITRWLEHILERNEM
jgi:hypothetical protein